MIKAKLHSYQPKTTKIVTVLGLGERENIIVPRVVQANYK